MQKVLPPQGLQFGMAAALTATFTSHVLDTIFAQNFTKTFSLKKKKIKALITMFSLCHDTFSLLLWSNLNHSFAQKHFGSFFLWIRDANLLECGYPEVKMEA